MFPHTVTVWICRSRPARTTKWFTGDLPRFSARGRGGYERIMVWITTESTSPAQKCWSSVEGLIRRMKKLFLTKAAFRRSARLVSERSMQGSCEEEPEREGRLD